MDSLIILDEGPGMLHCPISPTLVYVYHFDLGHFEQFLVFLQNFLQEIEVAVSISWQPITYYKIMNY
jgi:hypothetical protein